MRPYSLRLVEARDEVAGPWNRTLRYNPPPCPGTGSLSRSASAEQTSSARANVRRLRKQGLVPGVLYGKVNKAIVGRRARPAHCADGPVGAQRDRRRRLVTGQTSPHHAILKDFQQHPIRGTITHVDFHEVRLDQPIQTTVPVALVGESEGSKVGGVLTQVARELNVEALPTDVPEHIDVDVVGAGDRRHAAPLRSSGLRRRHGSSTTSRRR